MVLYGWLKVAFGIFCLVERCHRHLSTGGMLRLLERHWSVGDQVNFIFNWVALHLLTEQYCEIIPKRKNTC